MRINSTSALVTGGASGLGEATARALHAAGATVTLFDRDEARAKATAEAIGGATTYVAGDVGDPDAVTEAVELAASAGAFRITVSCAGIGWAQRTIGRNGEAHDLDAFKTVVNVNLIGTFNVMRIAAGAMSKTEPL
jgi:NAD(P)-dependent dehydrogenase (short-subunit alcohol dehydrogenase family)